MPDGGIISVCIVVIIACVIVIIIFNVVIVVYDVVTLHICCYNIRRYC